ncbi:ABC transporter ATP-binding protein [Selenomonas sp.]|uniref:ABC transporter ATP-binding protein n=1 Tax=Selenomonas sp. TaxID=2053611 RepID=UPI0025D4C8A0|nr:ABC transporter ATP-binding protein [Selenomonas sp.]MCI6283181.1 ABC transporter ATP-binding protein [Selenomonas sp.]
MIEIKDLSVTYDRDGKTPYEALDHVRLTVPKGTVCAVLGPSGCGKSTLIKAVAGLLPAATGTVTMDGAPINPRQSTIGFMPQNYGLLPWRTALENVLLGPTIRKQDVASAKQRAGELFAVLGIAGLEARYPKGLSGGQQQRVALARAFLLQPDVLLMDEPFSALDAITREEMQDVFLGLWQRERVTTLLVTHYVEEAVYLGQEIVLMRTGGRIAACLENPLAGQAGARGTAPFFEMARDLREKIREMKA